jgi:hypothetical protein
MLDPLVDRAALVGVLRDVLGAQAVISSCWHEYVASARNDPDTFEIRL